MEKRITFRLTETERDQLQRLAEKQNVSISKVLRSIIEQYLDRQAEEKGGN